MTTIREFDYSRDSAALRDCFIELQNSERQLNPGKPEGSTMVEAYLSWMFAHCREWNGRVFVAEVAGQVIGFVCIWGRVPPNEPDEDPAEYALVSDLVVSAAHRRRGIGSQLLSAAERFARAQGAPSLRIGLSAGNTAARSLYELVGFQEHRIELAKRLP
jgi:ribosomal protein S18 acetylase RimI-like enzyme